MAILLSVTINAQRNTAFFGGSITSIGPGLHIGYEAKSITFTAGWTHSAFNPSIYPDVYYATAGYVYQFSSGNSYNLSFHGGYAYTTKRIVRDHDYFGDDKKKTFIVNLEVGKDIASGRIYITTGYVTKPYFGIAFRGYF